jgi:hypothetical protein
VRCDLCGTRHRNDVDGTSSRGEESVGDAREGRRDSGGASVDSDLVNRLNSRVLAHGNHEPTATELEIEARGQWTLRFGNQVQSGDTGVSGTVGDELRDILSADENGFKLTASRRAEDTIPGRADFKPGVVEQLTGVC